ncbi:hypothetical protein [Streptomyces sp. cg36]|uniref:hypothetical protein n=1 Tax=Streptomyces sp. cg36 TaxID=3238798 RepID=UPI0034E2A8AD
MTATLLTPAGEVDLVECAGCDRWALHDDTPLLGWVFYEGDGTWACEPCQAPDHTRCRW